MNPIPWSIALACALVLVVVLLNKRRNNKRRELMRQVKANYKVERDEKIGPKTAVRLIAEALRLWPDSPSNSYWVDLNLELVPADRHAVIFETPELDWATPALVRINITGKQAQVTLLQFRKESPLDLKP